MYLISLRLVSVEARLAPGLMLFRGLRTESLLVPQAPLELSISIDLKHHRRPVFFQGLYLLPAQYGGLPLEAGLMKQGHAFADRVACNQSNVFVDHVLAV